MRGMRAWTALPANPNTSARVRTVLIAGDMATKRMPALTRGAKRLRWQLDEAGSQASSGRGPG